MKLLIDECLSPDLVEVAVCKGHPESSHVVWLGKAGWKDWELEAFILDGDWTFVTRNSVDFRGPGDRPGTKGQYADVLLHAGLICINGPVGMGAELQGELLEIALEEIGTEGELINGVLEVSLDDPDGEVGIVRYDLPRNTGNDAASVLSQRFYYIVARVFGRWNLQLLSMRKGGCAGCSSR